MIADLLYPYGTAVLIVIAVIPGLIIWWSGRALARDLDDPALPERLAARRQRRHGPAVGIVIAIILFGWSSAWYWAIPLTIVASMAGGFPLRKALYTETWGLLGYVSLMARASIAFFGFWLSLAFMPDFANVGAPADVILAGAAAGVLWLWGVRHTDVTRFLLRARPIRNEALVSRFTALADACGIPTPRFEYFDLRGGAIANAVALPDLRRSSVVFTDTLLSIIDDDEAVAICAHEIAHLEHYNPQRLRRLGLVTAALILASVATVPVARMLGDITGVSVVWAGAIVLTMVGRARFRQRHETESDLRALTLTGNAEALISGLTKLHAFARIPRRWDSDRERLSTHPSLARRIRDIRAAAAIAPAPVAALTTFASSDGQRSLAFTESALQIVEGHTATHILSYGGLTELRLDARRVKGVRLIAVQRDGQRWEVPVAASDLAAIQSALDLADAHLAAPDGLSRHWPRPARLIAFMAALSALSTGQFAMIVLALLTRIELSPPVLMAAGTASVATGALAVRGRFPDLGSAAGLAGLLAIFGGVLIWMAWTIRTEVKPRRMRTVVAVLTVCAACLWLVLLSDGLHVADIYRHARAWPGAAVLTLAVAAALAAQPQRATHLGAAAAAVAGLFAAAAGSTVFLERFGHDPLLRPAAAMSLRPLTGEPALTFDVPFDISELMLSPGGRHLALRSESSGRGNDDEVTTFHIGAAGKAFVDVSADDLVFVDDDHVVILEENQTGARLSELLTNGSRDVVWQQDIDDISRSTLSVDPATRRWRLLGWDDDGRLAQVEGTLGTSDLHRARWPLQESLDGSWTVAVAASDRGTLVVDVNYASGLPLGLPRLFRTLLGEPLASTTTVRRADSTTSIDVGRSRLPGRCSDETQPTGRIICSVYDGTHTRFVALDTDSQTPTAIGALRGRFVSLGRVKNGWLSGWLGRSPVALRISGDQAMQVLHDRKVNELAANDDTFATVAANDDGSTIRLYPRKR